MILYWTFMLMIGADLTSTLVERLLGFKEGGRGMCNNINFWIVTVVVVRWGKIPPLSLPSDCLVCLHLNPVCLSFSLHPVSPPFSVLPPSLSPLSISLSLSPTPSLSLYPPLSFSVSPLSLSLYPLPLSLSP